MTDNKPLILKLRRQGLPYSEIASQLRLSPNTVKSVCRRNMDMPLPKQNQVCKNCGSPLKQSSGKQKIFCCDKCRYTWWNHNRREKIYHLKCYQCGKEFISCGNRNRKFCSRECYLRSRYGEGLP